jgi:arginyl-tRNA synthetase
LIRAAIEALRREVSRACAEDLKAPLESPVVEIPADTRLGDLAAPAAFELARRLRRAPRDIARDLARALRLPEGMARAEAAGAGYVNVFLDRRRFARALGEHLSRSPAAGGEQVIVEHTSINPNKAAHIGHLRNAVLGDTLVRLLHHTGSRVDVQNYIDDTGVQLADLMVGFEDLRGLGAAEVGALAGRFDYLCWDLYAEVGEHYAADPARLERRRAMLERLEKREPRARALADLITDRIVRAHLATMERLGVRYDLLAWEGDILALRFWERAFERLKAEGAVHLVTEGKNAGCWVMALGPREEGGKGPGGRAAEGGDAPDDEAKIIVRSNGTVTYVGKDIAYQMWKFGLLGADFRYRIFQRSPDGATLYSTTAGPGVEPHPPFGHARAVYNVIDSRQAYLQRVVAEGLRALGHTAQAERSAHFSYEMVALSHACARELGYQLSAEDEARPFVEVSGRKGLGVKADDLIDRLLDRARAEVRSRHADLGAASLDATASSIAVGALRYFMLKFTRNKIIAFDFDEALAFEGETGPYLAYSTVRAANILRKLREREGDEAARVAADDGDIDWGYLESAEGIEHWSLMSALGRDVWTGVQALQSLELSLFAKYLFSLAQQFNTFYHHYPVIQESHPGRRRLRVLLCDLFVRQMRRSMNLAGLPIPERM